MLGPGGPLGRSDCQVVGAVDSRQLEGTVHRAGCDCRELTRQLGGGRSLATGEDARSHTRTARAAAPRRRAAPPPASACCDDSIANTF